MSRTPPIISRHTLDTAATRQQLDLACREWGTFYLVDHGISQAQSARLLEHTRAFFNLPKTQKKAVRRTASNAWGYFDQELTKNTQDWKEIFDYGTTYDANCAQWPTHDSGFETTCSTHFATCEAIAFDLLAAISVNLGLAPDFLFHAFEPVHSSFVRLNYYPTCPYPAAPPRAETPKAGFLGVNHHTDAGALTILLTDTRPGLEVYVRDEWHPVEPLPNALFVNLGDIIQVWSNDRYHSPLHRVRACSTDERISIPFFFNPHPDFNYAPLTRDDEAARYEAINWREFRDRRSAGTSRMPVKKCKLVITKSLRSRIMSFIDPVDRAGEQEHVQAIYNRQISAFGYLPNYAPLFTHRPDVIDLWAELQKGLRRHVSPRLFELITLAAAVALKSSYCALAHGVRLQTYFSTPEIVKLAQGEYHGVVSPAEACRDDLCSQSCKGSVKRNQA